MADTEKIIRKKYDVPIWHKSNLTIDEAVEYSGIGLSLIHISEPTRLGMISYAVFCLKKKKN